MLLAGDFGGTNARLALFENKRPLKRLKLKKYVCANYSSFVHVVQEFLSQNPSSKIEGACFGIAGPAFKRKTKDGYKYKYNLTNLNWEIDQEELEKKLGISRIFLLNDLQAKAYGVLELNSQDFYVLNKGEPTDGNALVIAPGTGLGEACMVWKEKYNKHVPFSSEGGHTEFAPVNELEIGLLKFLQKTYDHVSYERVVSGQGLHNIYQYLVASKKVKPLDNMKELSVNQLAELVTQKAIKDEDEGCALALDTMISIFGRETGNAALKFFAVSGVYLGGGIPPIILEKLKSGTFMKSFCFKGRFSSLMQKIPVKVILNQCTSLIGAAAYAIKK